MVYRWHAGKLQIHFTFYHRLLVFISWWLRWQRICLQRRRSLGWEDPWQREWLSTPVFLLGEVHGQRSLAGYSPRSCKKSDTAKWLTFHPSQYNPLIFPLVQGHKNPKYSRGNLNFQFSGNIAGFLVEEFLLWGPKSWAQSCRYRKQKLFSMSY